MSDEREAPDTGPATPREPAAEADATVPTPGDAAGDAGASPEGAASPDDAAEAPTAAVAEPATPRRGRVRVQDESTTPREPTVAERRARDRAARRAREAEEQRLADEAAGRKKRRRILVGGGVAVGIVAVIAVGYALAQPEDEVDAQCIDQQTGVIVDDSNCAVPAADTSYNGGGYYGGGFFPIFIGGGGRQYYYNYGGTGAIGQPVSGGTTVVPKDGTRVRTSSGSSTVTRGGLGVSRSSSGSSGGTSVGGGSSDGGLSGSKSGSKSGGGFGSGGGGKSSGS